MPGPWGTPLAPLGRGEYAGSGVPAKARIWCGPGFPSLGAIRRAAPSSRSRSPTSVAASAGTCAAPTAIELFLNHRRGSWADRCARYDVTHPSPESLLVESRWLTGLTLALCRDGNRAADLFQATWLVAMT